MLNLRVPHLGDKEAGEVALSGVRIERRERFTGARISELIEGMIDCPVHLHQWNFSVRRKN